MELKGITITLHPSKAQADYLKRIVGAQRWLWNRFLSCNIFEHMFTRKFIFYNRMANRLPSLKKEFPWLSEIPSQTLQQTLKRLHKAIKSVFKSGFGFPKFKSRQSSTDSATFPQGFKVGEDAITFPKVGTLPFRNRDNVHLKRIRNITVKYDRTRDRWFASLTVEDEIAPLPKTGKALGLDAGSVRLHTDSEGDFVPALRHYPQAELLLSRIERTQKKLSSIDDRIKSGEDRTRFSTPLEKVRERIRKSLATLHRKLASWCRDFLHKASRTLVERCDLIAVEDLKLRNMTRSARGTLENPGKNVAQKSGLNRSLLSNRIGLFFAMLEYKCRWYGKTFIKVNPKHTSQACSACGHIDKDNRKSQAVFKCVKCGHTANADHNAAINILAKGLESARLSPVVAGFPSR